MSVVTTVAQPVIVTTRKSPLENQSMLSRSLALGALLLTSTVAGAQSRPAAAATRGNAPAVQGADTRSTWTIDATHSELNFRIRHLLGRVNGTFTKWGGTVAIDSANWANSSVNVEIQTASIDTREPKRDQHLRSPDFFAADSFPTITFRSTTVERQGNDLRVMGNLTIRGRTQPATLVGKFEGQGKDPWGNDRVAFTATTTIDRQKFGVAWNSVAETGAMLGDEVQVDIAIEAVRQK